MAASECMRHNRGQKAIRSQIQGAKKKKNQNANQKFYIQQIYPSKMKENLRHSQKNKNWENLLLEDLPYMKY